MALYSKGIYINSPIPLQNAQVSIKGLTSRLTKRSSGFDDHFAAAKERECWSVDRIREFQHAKLISLVQYALNTVPFYQQMCRERGIVPSEIRTKEDLSKLPILEKEEVRQAPQRFVPSDLRLNHLVRGYTSGTSGSPIMLMRTLDSIRREHAFVCRQFRWAGCGLRDKIAVLRGDMIVPTGQRWPPYWRRDWAENKLLLSSYHLSESTMPHYVEALRHFQPVLIYAYPSAVYLLAEYVLRNGLQLGLSFLRGVVTSSETLSVRQRSTIVEAFGCSVFDWYGLAERVVFIGTCRHASYHVFEDYGYTELLPIDDSRFQLVGTGFINNAMPLIRYRTGDVVELDENQNCSCGSPFLKIKTIEGRMDDLVRLRDGTIIGRLDLIYKGLEGIREAQIIQSTYEDFTIRAVLDDNCNGNTLDRLRENLYSRLGNNVRLVVEKVPSIERTASGKFSAVISHVTGSSRSIVAESGS